DQTLQLMPTGIDQGENFTLARSDFTRHAVSQQRRAFAHTGQWRLELMGHVTEELLFLCLKVTQPGGKPIKPLSQLHQFSRPLYAIVPAGFDTATDTQYSPFELAYRANDQPAE